MAYGNFCVKCGEGGGKRRCGVAVDEHEVGLCLRKAALHARKHLGGDRIQRLSLGHDIKVIVRLKLKTA